MKYPLMFFYQEVVIFMSSAMLVVGSLTEANKGKSFLSGLNIKCRVEKLTSAQGGCAHGIRVYGDAEKASRLLGTVNIQVRKIIRGSTDI